MDTLMGFDWAGRAEPMRMMYSITGTQFIDKRIDFQKEWPEQKSTTPTGFLPVLITAKGAINESKTIARYLGRELGLSGKDSWEQALHDCVLESIYEATRPVGELYYWKVHNGPKPAKEEEEVVAEYKKCLEYLERIAKERGAKFIIGDDIGLAECWTYHTLMWVKLTIPSIVEVTDWTKALVQNMESDPRVKSYLDSRPPFTN